MYKLIVLFLTSLFMIAPAKPGRDGNVIDTFILCEDTNYGYGCLVSVSNVSVDDIWDLTVRIRAENARIDRRFLEPPTYGYSDGDTVVWLIRVVRPGYTFRAWVFPEPTGCGPRDVIATSVYGEQAAAMQPAFCALLPSVLH